jgi:16S rRNA (uracil1498-N3)-methyltransferase
MRVSRIYYDGYLFPKESISLPPETSHYIKNVLRLKIGSDLILFNGKGGEYQARIKRIDAKNVVVAVAYYRERFSESPLNIHLAQAISRSAKMDWILQKAVELGINRITPVITDYCIVKLTKDSAVKRLAHWQKVIISACEQSGRTLLPDLDPVQTLPEWLKTDLKPLRLFCDPDAKTSLRTLSRATDVLILIGPEGGLSESEVSIATAHNFIGISLGPRILRMETAPLTAIAILQHAWGDI